MAPAAPQADVFDAIADPTRRAMLLRLGTGGATSVSELMRPFRISQPAVSKHLRILRHAGLVRRRRQGRLQLYEVRARRLREVHEWASHFEKYWDEKLDALGEYLDRRAGPT